MKEQLEKELFGFIDAAKKAGRDTIEFLKEQSPELFKEIVTIKFYEGLREVIAGVILGAGVIPLGWYLALHYGIGDIREMVLSCTVIMTAILGLISLGMLYSGCSEMLEAKISPRLVVIKYLRNLVTGDEEE